MYTKSEFLEPWATYFKKTLVVRPDCGKRSEILKCVTECFGRIFIVNICVLLPLLPYVPLLIVMRCIVYDYVFCRKWLNKLFRLVIDGWCIWRQRNIKDMWRYLDIQSIFLIICVWFTRYLFILICFAVQLTRSQFSLRCWFAEHNQFLGSMLHRKRWSVSFFPEAKCWKNDSPRKILLNENTLNLRRIIFAYSFKNRNKKFCIC